jgi:hypothetical protein
MADWLCSPQIWFFNGNDLRDSISFFPGLKCVSPFRKGAELQSNTSGSLERASSSNELLAKFSLGVDD